MSRTGSQRGLQSINCWHWKLNQSTLPIKNAKWITIIRINRNSLNKATVKQAIIEHIGTQVIHAWTIKQVLKQIERSII